MEEAAKSRLGRGLAALMGDVDSEGAVLERARRQRRVPIEFLAPNPRNPRKSFEENDLDDLTQSVREKGIVQPIIVRPDKEIAERYEIIAGERRWRAAQKAGLPEVPVIINEVSDKEALEIAIIENVQRADLNPLEEALGYQQLIDEFAYTQQDMATVIGKSRSHVANTLRLLKLPDQVQDYLREGKLTAGHARALISAEEPEKLAEYIVKQDINVRDAEKLGQKSSLVTTVSKPEKDTDNKALEVKLSDALGLKVLINHGQKGAGHVKIAYRNLEQLDEICRRLIRD